MIKIVVCDNSYRIKQALRNLLTRLYANEMLLFTTGDIESEVRTRFQQEIGEVFKVVKPNSNISHLGIRSITDVTTPEDDKAVIKTTVIAKDSKLTVLEKWDIYVTLLVNGKKPSFNELQKSHN